MKRYLIYGLIGSLVIAGLLGIIVLLGGKYEELQIRILFTTLTFTVYSIIGLCCNSILESKYSLVGKLGLIVTFIGLLYAIGTTWATPNNLEFIQLRISLLVIAICFAHCSLMLLVKTYNSTISIVRNISILASVTVACIIVGMVSAFDRSAVETYKILGVISIVGIITTIVAPILALTAKRTNK